MSFGYLKPKITASVTDSPQQWCNELRKQIEGFNNLLKRIQVKAVKEMLNLSTDHAVLELGAGTSIGYAVEFSKLVRKYIATDIADLKSINEGYKLPASLTLRSCDAHSLPFNDNMFDIVLMSEVISVLKDPIKALHEVRRVLRPKGRVVIVSGGQYLHVKDFYTSRNPLVRRLLKKGIKFGHIPPTYAEYHANLIRYHGTNKDYFYDREAFIKNVLIKADFKIEETAYSVRRYANLLYQYLCFSRLCNTGNILLSRNYIYYLPLLILLDKLKGSNKGMAFLTSALNTK
ncbi:MAG: class I SAM-dependent methyltransferase [Desulfobacula sp.]|nr:class I SAM-dependent methyltransferase [Desulfobacula sp.]